MTKKGMRESRNKMTTRSMIAIGKIKRMREEEEE